MKTQSKLFVTMSAFIIAAFAFSGCSNKAAMEAIQKKGLELVAAQLPIVGELTGKLDGLKEKLALVPDVVPGAKELKALLGTNSEELGGIKDLFDGAEGQMTGLIEKGDKEGLSGLFDKLSGAKDTLAGLVSGFGASEEKAGEMLKNVVNGVYVPWHKDLSDGFKVHGQENGIEKKLVGFLEDGEKEAGHDVWFNFDRLGFKTGSSELDLERSGDQLDMVAHILKAYPAAKMKLGGYTDNTGNADKNLALSKERADHVRDELVKQGIAADRFVTEGYGSGSPVCPANDTDECRAQNRRIAANLFEK